METSTFTLISWERENETLNNNLLKILFSCNQFYVWTRVSILPILHISRFRLCRLPLSPTTLHSRSFLMHTQLVPCQASPAPQERNYQGWDEARRLTFVFMGTFLFVQKSVASTGAIKVATSGCQGWICSRCHPTVMETWLLLPEVLRIILYTRTSHLVFPDMTRSFLRNHSFPPASVAVLCNREYPRHLFTFRKTFFRE